MSRRQLLGAAGLGIAAVPLIASAGAAVAGRTPLRLGVLVDLTGPMSTHGGRQLLGIEYQAEQINALAESATVVELLVADTKGDEATTTSEVKRLIGEGVHGLVGTSAPWIGAIVAQAGQQSGVPVVIPSSGWPPEEPFVFRSGVPFPLSFKATMAAVAGKRVGRFQQERLQSARGDRLLEQEAAANGVTFTDRVFMPSEATDLRPQVEELLRSEPDVVYVSTLPPGNGLAARDLHAAGWTGPVYCSASAGHPGFFETAGAGAEGVHLIGPWPSAWRDAPTDLPNHHTLAAFGAAFEAEHGPMGTYVGYGADAVGMLYTAYNGGTDANEARERLEQLTYQGVTGTFTMSPTDHAGLAAGGITVLTAREGRWTNAGS